ncbi:MAG: DUF4259 domain-containing protein [Phycisphaerales bacterium]|nr:DUF4259 domain-containing protein [Phycisphaerales bacterium]
MGTWGYGSFENDTASDWIWELKPAKKSILGKLKEPFGYPMSAVDALLRSDLYLECSECDEAIAASECLAAAVGSPMENPPEEIPRWVASLNGTKPDAELIQRSIRAVEKVRDDEHSESRALWSESSETGDPDPQWIASINNLISRLKSPAK